MEHPTTAALEAALPRLRAAPARSGILELIVRRPAIGERELLDEGELDPDHGLVGDTWAARGSRHTPDGRALPDRQLTLMNARMAALLAAEPEGWALAGDQLYLDLDLSEATLPPGTVLTMGSATVQITDQPHTGCDKFRARFGADALRFVNSDEGRRLHLRGVYARVVRAGTVRRGDAVERA